MKKIMKSQAGFSLVELMVVVAIIGVLTAVGVPYLQGSISKARQTEARTLLSGYYSGQKAAHAQYAMYPGNFVAIGFKPEGNSLNYRVAAVNNGNATIPNGVNPTNPACVDTAATTNCAGMPGGITWTEGPRANTALNVPVGAAAAINIVTNTFTTVAFGRISATNGVTSDTWSINELKNLQNTNAGL